MMLTNGYRRTRLTAILTVWLSAAGLIGATWNASQVMTRQEVSTLQAQVTMQAQQLLKLHEELAMLVELVKRQYPDGPPQSVP